MSKKQIIVVSVVVLVLALLAVLLTVLLRDDPDIPPDPLVDRSGSDAGVFVLEAGEDADAETDAEAGPSGKGPGKTDPRVSRLIACCRVVANNAKSVADPLARASMIQAASVCEASARSGQFDAVDKILNQYNVPCQ